MLIFLIAVAFGSRYEGTIVAKDHPNAQIYGRSKKWVTVSDWFIS
jgi:hypothetical protein